MMDRVMVDGEIAVSVVMWILPIEEVLEGIPFSLNAHTSVGAATVMAICDDYKNDKKYASSLRSLLNTLKKDVKIIDTDDQGKTHEDPLAGGSGKSSHVFKKVSSIASEDASPEHKQGQGDEATGQEMFPEYIPPLLHILHR